MTRGEGGPPAERRSGFRTVRRGNAVWVVRPECAAGVEAGEADFLLEGEGPRADAGGGGRGGSVPFSLCGIAAIGKRARHGGILGRLFGGLYLGSGRVIVQIDLADRLERAGVPTPEVLAAGTRRVFGPFRAHAIVTRAISGALNLYEAARDEAPWRRRRAILRAGGRLVRAMHDAGFLHADLNVTNLVLGGDPEGIRIYVVDLDRGRLVSRAGRRARHANLARLLRSCEKWMGGGTGIGGREEIRFLRAYCAGDRRLFRDLQHGLERYRRRLAARRLLWRRRGAGASGLRPGRSE